VANTITYYNAVQTHYFAQDADISAGYTTAQFTRNFRVLDMTVFINAAVAGATLTLSRYRGGVYSTIASFDASGVGRAPILIDIDQTAGLLESGDFLFWQTSAAGVTSNSIVYVQQFSI
jgi:hypothetical protein